MATDVNRAERMLDSASASAATRVKKKKNEARHARGVIDAIVSIYSIH
jgi:hypothetical protein